jgi:hypothetical protein
VPRPGVGNNDPMGQSERELSYTGRHTGHDLPDRVVAVDGRRRILRAVRQTGVKEGDP